jgi:CelD/BcsL family acetyltransferase involved in cellulose biosynthesis
MGAVATTLEQGKVTGPAFLVECLRGGLETIDQLADEWRELCDVAANDQPFYRPEWIRAYLRAFVPGARLLIITVRRQQSLCLVLPLVTERGTFSKIPVRKLRSAVNNWGGRLDAIRKPDQDGDAAILAAWSYLKDLGGWDLLQLQYSLHGSAIGQLAAAARADGFEVIDQPDRPSPYVLIPTDPELLKQMPLNSRLRRELRQVRRQLSARGTLNFYRLDASDRDELERFYQLEASGWKGREGSSILSLGLRPFFDEIAESATHFGYFSLYLLELNEDLLAAHFGFTLRKCYYSVIVAYNESFADLSPGHLIISEIVRDCAERGVCCFDVTGQDQGWKLKWTNQTQAVSHYHIFRGARGSLAYAVSARLKPAVRQFFAKRNDVA